MTKWVETLAMKPDNLSSIYPWDPSSGRKEESLKSSPKACHQLTINI